MSRNRTRRIVKWVGLATCSLLLVAEPIRKPRPRESLAMPSQVAAAQPLWFTMLVDLLPTIIALIGMGA